MKHIPLIAVFSAVAFTSGFANPPEMTELEKELLSLESEFLDLSEAAETVSSEEITVPLEPETEDMISLAEDVESGYSVSVDKISPEEPVAIQPVPVYPHEEKLQTGSKGTIEISLKQVFAGSPFIYSILLGMSFTSIAVCLYSILRIKQQMQVSRKLAEKIPANFSENREEQLSGLCKNDQSWLGKIVMSGLSCKKHGLNTILENMKAEGKRATLSAWQQLGILQDIAIISPMLGLLGTVIGLFYAFYDLNRSLSSISGLLDGLGISVGTTVAGICVAILSMILHSIAKFRLVRSLARIEVEANRLAYLIDENK
jgi:biopolymer transport protein ExbB